MESTVTVVLQSHTFKTFHFQILRLRTLKYKDSGQDEETTNRNNGSNFGVVHTSKTENPHHVQNQLESYTA